MGGPGGGMFYAQDTGNPRFDMARNLAGRRRDIGTPAIIDLTWNVPFRGLGAGPNGTDLVPQPYGLANIYNRRTPYSIQYLLNVQRELGGNTALEIGYIGSVSRRLESLRAFNEAYPTADPTLSVAIRSPYPELGRFQEVDGSGKANYNAVSAKLQRRFSKGLTYMFGYTWSKSIDQGSAIRVHDTDVLFPQNSYNLRAERGLSSFNQDHRAVTSVLYDLPIGKGRRFLSNGGIADAIIGGWQLGSISPFRAVSPRPSLTTEISPAQALATTGQMRQASTRSSPATYEILSVGSTPTPSSFSPLGPSARRGGTRSSHPGAFSWISQPIRSSESSRITRSSSGSRRSTSRTIRTGAIPTSA